MTTDLELAYAALTEKKNRFDNYWLYFGGQQPLVYSREKLREIFSEINARFTQNWCSVVIDAAMDRIQLRQFATVKDTAANDALVKLVTDNELTLEADDVHLAALVTGEAFMIAWPDDDGVPQAYYNDPRRCHVFYEAANPRKKRMAAKWWQGDDEYVYMTLYYPDHIEYYETTKKVKTLSAVSSAKAFVPAELAVADNPYGVIPVFHFRRDRRMICSELNNVIEPQDAINKLLNDMMVAAEFGAFKQRWIITEANVSKLKNSPNEIWRVPPGAEGEQPTSLGEFSAADLTPYISAIDKFATAIAIITRTPKHYFFGQGGDPSGEALIAMEAPLNKKCQKYIDRFSSTWRELAHFLLVLQGVDIDKHDIAPVFDKPETVQPMTEAQTRQANVAAGVPLTTTLRDDGWTQTEIDQMLKDKKAETDAKNQANAVNPVGQIANRLRAAGQGNGQPTMQNGAQVQIVGNGQVKA